MALFHPGDTVLKSGFYQCIFCRQAVLLTKGSTFPQCPGKCRAPAYARTEKTIPPVSQMPRQ